MNISLTINGEATTFEVAANETLLNLLRREGYYGVKHGCDTGECGVCVVLMDGEPVLSCILLAAQADGRSLLTIEGLGERDHLHPVQEAFVDTGAIQCGFCTPAQILSAVALLAENPDPGEAEVREAIGGVLCRCTGYKKPVEAILQAATVIRNQS